MFWCRGRKEEEESKQECVQRNKGKNIEPNLNVERK